MRAVVAYVGTIVVLVGGIVVTTLVAGLVATHVQHELGGALIPVGFGLTLGWVINRIEDFVDRSTVVNLSDADCPW